MARPRFVLLALALLTLLLYSPVRQHAFLLYDDPEYITENPMVVTGLTAQGIRWAFTTFYAANWHPLTWLSHMLDCQLFGLDSGAHHLVNALWHTVNTALLFVLMLRLLGRIWLAALVAALFAWHPLHVQSVAWAAERKDVLSTCFGLLSLLAYLRWTEGRSGASPSASGRGSRSLWMAVLWFALSLLSKPMLVTLPFLLLLLDIWPLQRIRAAGLPMERATTPAQRTWAQAVREKWPFFLLTVLSSIITYRAQQSGQAVIALESHTLGARLLNVAASYAGYLWKTLWPKSLSIIYPLNSPSPVLVAAGLLLLIVGCYLAWRLRTSRPYMLVGWFWYIGMLVPVIGIVQVGGQAMADRYTYLPLVGIFMIVALEAEGWATRWNKRFVTAVFALVLLAFAGTTLWQLQFWRNSETLFARALAVTRNNAVAHVNYGMALEQAGRRAEARQHYAEAVRLNPNLPQAHNNLANLLDREDERKLALEHYEAALRLKPDSALAHANLASLLISMGRGEEARRHYGEAARLMPFDARPHYVVAKAWLKANDAREAIPCLNEALRRDPGHLASLTALARVLATAPEPESRDGARAVKLASRAADLTEHQHPLILDTLAAAYADAGQYPAAVKTQTEAIRLAQGGEPNLLQGMRLRLSQYEAGRPWREPPSEVVR